MKKNNPIYKVISFRGDKIKNNLPYRKTYFNKYQAL